MTFEIDDLLDRVNEREFKPAASSLTPVCEF